LQRRAMSWIGETKLNKEIETKKAIANKEIEEMTIRINKRERKLNEKEKYLEQKERERQEMNNRMEANAVKVQSFV
jgi:hypothetical protein